MQRVTLLSETGFAVSSVRMGGSLSVQVDFCCPGYPVRPNLEVSIKNSFGVTVFNASNRVITQYQFQGFDAKRFHYLQSSRIFHWWLGFTPWICFLARNTRITTRFTMPFLSK